MPSLNHVRPVPFGKRANKKATTAGGSYISDRREIPMDFTESFACSPSQDGMFRAPIVGMTNVSNLRQCAANGSNPLSVNVRWA